MSNVDHVLMTLLWSEIDEDGEQLDSVDAEVSDELVIRLTADWECFRENAERLGFDPEQHIACSLHPDNDGDAWNAVAHDFILTRNGHGVGFWERGRWLEPWDKKLTELSNIYGNIHAYVGDDGLIYAE